MTQYAPERPAVVTVIGWSSVVLAVLLFFSGLLSVAVVVLMQMASMDPTGLPPGFEEMRGLFQYTLPLSFLQVGVAVVMMVGSLLLLRLRETGRLILEALNWFGLVFTIAVNAWFIPAWSRVMEEAARRAPAQTGAAVLMSPWFMTTLGVVQVAVIVAIIWVLRSKTVRSAVH